MESFPGRKCWICARKQKIIVENVYKKADNYVLVHKIGFFVCENITKSCCYRCSVIVFMVKYIKVIGGDFYGT